MEEERLTVPSGIGYLKGTVTLNAHERLETADLLTEHKDTLIVIGDCLSVLFQAGSCHRGCRGGDHLLERLCSRAYNLALGAYSLTEIGLYDEALILVRTLREMANLIALFNFDKNKVKEWSGADKKARL